MSRITRLGAIALIFLALSSAPRPADAHINSPDLFHEGMAGPYRLLVTIRPPEVIPGVAAIEVLATRADLRAVTLVPIPIHGPGAISPPVADVAVRDAADPHLYRGNLWLMATGSWQVRVHADGPDGGGDLSVPVAAIAVRTRRMQAGLGALLLALLVFLFAGLVSIIGASVREAALAPGAVPEPRRQRRALVAQLLTALVLTAAIAGGKSWWGREAIFYGRLIYKPLALQATVTGAEPSQRALALTLSDPGWLPSRHLDDLLPDHGHLMHLFVVRLPGLDAIAHLHPTEVAPGHFTQPLPTLPPGRYQLFADIVHASGLAETATTTIDVPTGGGVAPTGDDAVGLGPPIAATPIAMAVDGAAPAPDPTVALADGTRVTWLQHDDDAGATPASLVAGHPSWFRFHVADRDGRPAQDVLPYMGMAGHAVFLARDRSVFAHVHPSGSVAMAALALVAPKGSDPHAGHHMRADPLPAEIAFPYACPRAGDYRIFVQFRRGDTIETAIFDAHVR